MLDGSGVCKCFYISQKGTSFIQTADPELPITMAADASAYGVGTIISHVYPDGHEKPVVFASRTLPKSEQNYTQLEKEALALIFGIKQFHQYLYARQFILVIDYCPLTTILHPQKGITSLAAARLQQWAIILSVTSMISLWSPPSSMAMLIAFLGCHYLLTQWWNPFGVDVFNVAQVDSLPVVAEQLGQATRKDPVLSKVLHFTNLGGPRKYQST